METKRSYDEEFEPLCRWGKEEHQYILEVHVQGFKKDQLKIELTTGFKKDQLKILFNTSGVLKITGKRPIYDPKFIRFQKTVNVPKDCRTMDIHARISGGILYITMPRKIPKDQPAITTGTAALNGRGRNTARRLGVAIGVAVAVAVGGYLAYKFRRCFQLL
ncbi:inactive protein RESTRICTED TEV MOVEMENT 2-like isoform X2 [Mangifera indica]|uniref:inactive protein RESTRICTED TEV MOVEMENT 2-like isoform X2 n=1 Tax=Mangifera indica TaxID=29780 RepID=UPI001CF94EA1|nr:inactive protein RESTRICTED TEV MOVEMENT 2-like isoform X2 [Mangifera indica]